MGPTLNPRITYNRMVLNVYQLRRSGGTRKLVSNQFKAAVRPVKNLDLEMMAYASTEPAGTGFIRQFGGAMWSTGNVGSIQRASGIFMRGGTYLPHTMVLESRAGRTYYD